ncbi:hypothetical protein GCM10010218_48670 [Streptomyces mashuensis]|uniref:Gp28/Gp37-like domain-containing protein n=1 Tax=Streptomyces mashuensis TaxID=33904 RepID=A0A919EF20_9ACTN|nr:siphovirus ReqiPepy6 Gp37-like family protein [Streptomyces mashuensis]GHF61393.1 hypothetical protein GCM10010218_48670 [Streptomyces mashuensis]
MGYRVEVRGRPDEDGLIHRIGELDTWIKLDLIIRYNAQGTWQLLVKDKTPQAKLLEKGGGIAVWMDGRDDEPIFSGQIEQFQKYWTVEQHTGRGSVYVGGKCDNKLPYQYLAFPGVKNWGTDAMAVYPANEQWKDRDRDARPIGEEAGQALWVEMDLAFGARGLPGRKAPGVTLLPPPAANQPGVPPKIGAKVAGTVRYDNLGTLAEKWTKEGGIGYRFLWHPDDKKIKLTTFVPQDKTNSVRFSPELGNLREYVATLTAPRVTRAIVAAQGEGKDRFIRQYPETGYGPDGLTDDEREWGLISEQFIDRRDIPLKTDAAGKPVLNKPKDGGFTLPPGAKDEAEALKIYQDAMKTAADAVLKESEKNGNFQIYPIETPQCRFGIDYFIGDKVSVDIEGEIYEDIVREVNITVEDGGRSETVVPKIGEQGTGEPLNLYKHVSDMREKLRKLEARM